MATIETNAELGEQVRADAKEYVLHSWSVQDAINPIPVAGAEGRYFWDYEGKRYLDFASQLVNVSIGYGHPKLIAAIKEQAERLCTIGPPMATEPRSQLGRLLAEVTPGDLKMSFFTSGGAEANENAIKLARWYTGPAQDHRPLSLLPRGHRGRDHAHRRPAPLARRAGDPGRRPDARSLHLPLSCRPSRSVSRLHGRAAPRGDPPVRGRAHRRRRDPRDRHGHERRDPAARRLPPLDPRDLRPAWDPADPRRGDGRLRPHRPLVRLRQLGRRPGHPDHGEGDQLRLRPARRDDRLGADLRVDPRQVPGWGAHLLQGIRSPARRPSPRSRPSARRGSSRTRPSTGSTWRRRSPRWPRSIRRSARCAASASSGASSW